MNIVDREKYNSDLETVELHRVLEICYSKAAALTLMLEGIDPSRNSSHELTLPIYRGMLDLAQEIEDIAWDASRTHCAAEHAAAFDKDARQSDLSGTVAIPEYVPPGRRTAQ